MLQVLALIDMNNFYVSCERVFQPALEGRPVIVLSNNDGCAIARSQEAKDLGIRMGDPWHHIRQRYTAAGGVALSSNYALYGDMSARIAEVLAQFSNEIETYSIDESFVGLAAPDRGDLVRQAQAMRTTVHQWTGIPCCVGLANTKTLAKAANHVAKKRLVDQSGVATLLDPAERERVLSILAAGDIWGVGRASTAKLEAIGVCTADDLARLDRRQARQLLTVVGERIIAELNGIPCVPLELAPPAPQGCAVTRSFGRAITTWSEMEEALASYATRAGEKLRRSNRAAGVMQVFMHTNRFNNDPSYSNAVSAALAEATSDSRVLAATALQLGRRIWRSGFRYSKSGVVLTELVDEGVGQRSMLTTIDRGRATRLMGAMDALNTKMGSGTLAPASAGVAKHWAVRADRRTPRYTTRWSDLPTVLA